MTLYVLFIDSYDSFTYNVVNLISNCLPEQNIQVTTIHNDSISAISEELLAAFDCIIVGPGPGNPKDLPTIGVLHDIFNNKNTNLSALLNKMPVLGICLGWQAMCFYQDFGNCDVKQLSNIRHGQVYKMDILPEYCSGTSGNSSMKNSEIFENYPPSFESVRYHSLHVELNQPLRSVSKIIPMVVCQDEDDGEILMGGKIADKPWYGVQYHPESCCSELGELLIQNFIRNVVLPLNSSAETKPLERRRRRRSIEIRNSLNNKIDKSPLLSLESGGNIISSNEGFKLKVEKHKFDIDLASSLNSDLSIPSVVLSLGELIGPSNFILLSSLMKQRNRGEYTIFGVPYANQSKIHTYNISERKIVTKPWGTSDPSKEVIISNRERVDFWKFIELEMYKKRQALKYQTSEDFLHGSNNSSGSVTQEEYHHLVKNLPFIGGFLGILNYEMGDCVSLLGSADLSPHVPDSVFVDVEQTIVWDHFENTFYFLYNSECSDLDSVSEFQNLIRDIKKHLECLSSSSSKTSKEITLETLSSLNMGEVQYTIERPNTEEYYRAFEKCQDFLHQGDSYELCLTTQCNISTKQSSTKFDSWELFKKLSLKNPAPFSSYFNIPNSQICLCSSSPERFLKWDNDLKDCELRPIKGTVKKTSEMTRAKATEILKTRKEFGENLMIVDLIRNDLYELLPQVTMKELMSVEEYETVYQLVSVISGSATSNSAQQQQQQHEQYTGLDILKHSLPPGSMTGAPKKNSVSILQSQIETQLCTTQDGKRNCYSGVTGYYSLNGRGDWSVNIRCIFTNDYENWKLGAGGAITVLSTKEGEWEEMLVKLESTLQIF